MVPLELELASSVQKKKCPIGHFTEETSGMSGQTFLKSQVSMEEMTDSCVCGGVILEPSM